MERAHSPALKHDDSALNCPQIIIYRAKVPPPSCTTEFRNRVKIRGANAVAAHERVSPLLPFHVAYGSLLNLPHSPLPRLRLRVLRLRKRYGTRGFNEVCRKPCRDFFLKDAARSLRQTAQAREPAGHGGVFSASGERCAVKAGAQSGSSSSLLSVCAEPRGDSHLACSGARSRLVLCTVPHGPARDAKGGLRHDRYRSMVSALERVGSVEVLYQRHDDHTHTQRTSHRRVCPHTRASALKVSQTGAARA